MIIILFVISVVCLVWGMIKNLVGYSRFLTPFKEGPLGNIYVYCQTHAVLRLFIPVLFLVSSMIFSRGQDERWLVMVLFSLPALSLLHTIILHFKAIRRWNERLDGELSPEPSYVYLASGVFATLLAFGWLVYVVAERGTESVWVLGLIAVVYAVSFLAYARMYRQVAAHFLGR